jgi:two-component system, LytTR family, sensor kinase
MEVQRIRPQPTPWAWIALIWSSVGLFDATQTVLAMRAQGMHHAWGSLFVTLLLCYLPWALATPLILQLGRRYPPIRLRPYSTWFLHLAAVAGINFAISGWNAWLETMLNPWAKAAPEPFRLLWFYKLYNGWLSSFFLYSAIITVSYVLDSRARLARHETESARLNEQLSKAQLDALRRQIEPHFLFNTLNAIAALVREHRDDDAVNMIAGLSDFLRRVIEDSGKQQVSLGEEIKFLQKYLDIQKVRFADRLQFRLDVPSELLDAQVPSLILQPMVENAIKHGIAKRAQGGLIRIAAARSNGMLNLSVYNDGPKLPANWDEHRSGIGLSNARTRLQSLYGEACDLTLRNHEPAGVELTVSVPFHEG